MPVTETQLSTRLKALRRARIEFRHCLADPLHKAMAHRIPLVTAQMVWELPTEAAAAGFTVAVMQDGAGWHVSLTRAIDDETEVHTAGDASSLLKSLFQVSDATERQFDELEAKTRHQLAQMETAAPLAA